MSPSQRSERGGQPVAADAARLERAGVRRQAWANVAAAAIVLLLLTPPLLIQDVYWLHILNVIGLYTLLAVGLNLVVGFCDTFSLGHAAFYGIGAYTAALASTRLGLPFWVTVPLAGLVGGLFGLAMGPVMRLRGPFLAVVTLAFGEVVRLVLFNWVDFTRGPNGIAGIRAPWIGGFQFDSDHRYYYLILAVALAQYVVITRLVSSRLGRAMKALRDNEDAALAYGVFVPAYKTLAFVIAAVFAGMAGGLYAHLISFISPDPFDLSHSIEMLFMVVIGGLGSVPGSVLGAAIVALLPELFRLFADFRLIVYSIVIILILTFAPRGLWGLLV